jgi:hypothetical protein
VFEEEVVVPAPVGVVPPLLQVRGLLITASLRALEQRGVLGRYFEALPKTHHEVVRSLIASSWCPEPVATAHYEACEALHLPLHEILSIGSEVGARIRDTFLGTVLRVAREAGTTPWTFFERLPRLFTRICVGGACAVYKLGPKEARAEWYALPGLRIPYFRTAFRGANQSIVELFCQKAYVSEVRAKGGGDWAFKASWV